MLKQKPATHSQSIAPKKEKKRSSSTSRNKQNISMSHNNSSLLQFYQISNKNQIGNKSQIGKNVVKSHNPVNKKKKHKKLQTGMRSAQKIRSIQHQVSLNNFTKYLPTVLKQVKNQTINRKTKKSNHQGQDFQINQSSMVIIQNDYSCSKGAKIHSVIQKQRNQINLWDTSSILNKNNRLQVSKYSNFLSTEERSKYNVNEELNKDQWFKRQQSKRIQASKEIRQAKFSNFINPFKKYKLTPSKAAIIIQKTWRGHLTRKLLEQYIKSFQPLYEQQLKQLRSGPQSRNGANNFLSTENKINQKSSFFDKSQQQGSSDISSFQVLNLTCPRESNQNNKSPKNDANVSSHLQGQACNHSLRHDLPLQIQYSMKGSKTQKQPQIQQFSGSRKIKAKRQTPQTWTRITQFTVLNNVNQGTSSRQQLTSSNEQTKKIKSSIHNLSLTSHSLNIKIQPSNLATLQSHIQSLNLMSKSLQNIFFSFNNQCISELKSKIKESKIDLTQLMERKDALKDIVINGRDFIYNVRGQISKAFKQMHRVTKEGCEQMNDENQENGPSDNEQFENSNKFQMRQNQSQHQNKERYSQCKTKQKDNIPIQYGEDSSKSSRYTDSVEKEYYGNKNKMCSPSNHSSQFYTIQLPTQEYQIVRKSPIQQPEQCSCDQDEYSVQQLGSLQGQQQHRSQMQESQRLNQNYEAHRQSFQILNQFLANLIEQYQEVNQTHSKKISELEYLCDTLKRVSCESQNKTIIDRCLIEFIVEMMSETYTLTEIQDAFRQIIYAKDQLQDNQTQNNVSKYQSDQIKLKQMLKRWVQELQKWEMNTIHQVPSKMESSSFINTQNISLIGPRQAIDNISNLSDS